jgi:muconolactone delta-isomerase
MKILAIEREAPVVDDHAYTPDLLQAEAQRAWELYQAGVVRELYFRADRTEAVIILEADSVEEAAAALASLPLVQAGLVAFELLPLKAYPGFARLFANRGA